MHPRANAASPLPPRTVPAWRSTNHSIRKQRFEDTFGAGAFELDGLDTFQEEFDEPEETFHAAVDDFMSTLGLVTDRLSDCCAESRRTQWRFDSSRTYADQFVHYKAYRNSHHS